MKTYGQILITGLSTDNKPTDTSIQLGTRFVETDTNDRFIYEYADGSKQWVADNSASDTNKNAVSKTYSELSDMITNSALVVGQYYVITDYKTIYKQYGTNIISSSASGISEGLDTTPEKIMVRAITENTLDDYGWSVDHTDEIIKYDPTSVDLGGVLTYGSITYRENIKQNIRVDFDYRAIQFRGYKPLLSAYDGGATYSEYATYNNVSYGYVYFEQKEVKICPVIDFMFAPVMNTHYTISSDTSVHTNVYCFNNIGFTPTDMIENISDVYIEGKNVLTRTTNSTLSDVSLYSEFNMIVSESAVSGIHLDGSSYSLVFNSSNVHVTMSKGISSQNFSVSESNGVRIGTGTTTEQMKTIGVFSCTDVSFDFCTDITVIEATKSKYERLIESKLIGASSGIKSVSEASSVVWYGSVSDCVFDSISGFTVNDTFTVSGSEFGTVNAVTFDCSVSGLKTSKLSTVTLTDCVLDGCSFNKTVQDVTLSKLNLTDCYVDVRIKTFTPPSTTVTLVDKHIDFVKPSGVLGYSDMLESGARELVFIT